MGSRYSTDHSKPIVKMFVDGAGKDIDCMACLVAEARNAREP